MSKNVKILVLVLSVLPVVLYFLGYIGFVASMMSSMGQAISGSVSKANSPDLNPPVAGMMIMFISMGMSALLALGMLIFYIWNLVVTNRVPRDMKPVWGVLLFVGSFIAWVVYWYNYIWREPIAASDVTTSMPSHPAESAGDEG